MGSGDCGPPPGRLVARAARWPSYTNAGLTPDGSSTYYLPRIVGTRRTLVAAHHRRAIVLLGEVHIVSAAGLPDVVDVVTAAFAIGNDVMKLQTLALCAAMPVVVDERAAIAVPLAHSAPHSGRDVP